MKPNSRSEEVHLKTTMNRRKFVQGLGLVALTVTVLPATGEAQSALGLDALTIRSGPGRFIEHYHDLQIPYQLLRLPPAEGVVLSTSRTLVHTHRVRLTQQQLYTIANGGEVSVQDSVKDHWYVIKRTH